MSQRLRVIVCLVTVVVLCCALAEGRWHDLRNLRKHRTLEQSQDNDRLPRLFDNEDGFLNRHRRHRPSESGDDQQQSSDENNQDLVDTPRPPSRMEFDGDPEDYQEDVKRMPTRHRLVHPKKTRVHHRRHRTRHHKKPTLDDLNEALYLEYDEGIDLSRDKRHQRRRNWTEEDWKAFESSRRPELYDHDIHVFELEVREAQNSSLCNYTVIPIPDPGGRVPRVLEHVKCNYVGNRCRERGSYCCVQTYRNVEVTYPGNKNDTIKVYSGCVCALQIFGTLKPYNPKLPIDD